MKNVINFPKLKDFSKVSLYDFLCASQANDRESSECNEFYIVFGKNHQIIGFVYFDNFVFEGVEWCGVYSIVRGQEEFSLVSGVDISVITTKSEAELEEIARAMLDGERCEVRYVVDSHCLR